MYQSYTKRQGRFVVCKPKRSYEIRAECNAGKSSSSQRTTTDYIAHES